MDQHQDTSKHNPGMDLLTGVYLGLSFVLYLLYFWLVYIRWEVS